VTAHLPHAERPRCTKCARYALYMWRLTRPYHNATCFLSRESDTGAIQRHRPRQKPRLELLQLQGETGSTCSKLHFRQNPRRPSSARRVLQLRDCDTRPAAPVL